jgi:hypothetical protein
MENAGEKSPLAGVGEGVFPVQICSKHEKRYIVNKKKTCGTRLSPGREATSDPIKNIINNIYNPVCDVCFDWILPVRFTPYPCERHVSMLLDNRSVNHSAHHKSDKGGFVRQN